MPIKHKGYRSHYDDSRGYGDYEVNTNLSRYEGGAVRNIANPILDK